jgi:hypothetical protein
MELKRKLNAFQNALDPRPPTEFATRAKRVVCIDMPLDHFRGILVAYIE